MKRSNRVAQYFLAPSFLFMTIIFLYPTIYTIYISFFQYNLINVNVEKVFIYFNNFIKAFSDPSFQNSLLVTLKFIILAVPSCFHDQIALSGSISVHRCSTGKCL